MEKKIKDEQISKCYKVIAPLNKSLGGYITMPMYDDHPEVASFRKYLSDPTVGDYISIRGTSINVYFFKLLLEKDAYFETRQKEDDFVNKIVAAVGERLEKEIPNFILACIANFATAKYTSLEESRQEENSENTAENSDIDWDFLGDE